jgi:Domain of unknown function (DUF1707)
MKHRAEPGSVEAPVTAGPWNPVTARRTDRDRLRASDADREQVIDTLKTAFVQGRLAKEEFCAHAGQALASRTYGELAAITLSIPPRPSEAPPPRAGRTPDQKRIDKKTAAWGMFMLLMPVTLGIAFLTHYVGFFAMFLIAFIGVAVTAQPDG